MFAKPSDFELLPGASASQTTSSQKSKKNDSALDKLAERVRHNDWLKAKDIVSDAVGLIRSEVMGKQFVDLSPDSLSRIGTGIKNVIRVAEYFDLLRDEHLERDKSLSWVTNYIREFCSDRIQAKINSDPDHLHRFLDFLTIEMNRKSPNLKLCFEVADFVENKSKELESDLRGDLESQEKLKKNLAMFSFLSRLNFIRHTLALHNNDRKQAEMYLEKSAHHLTSQVKSMQDPLSWNPSGTELKQKDISHKLYLQTAKVGLARVFLRIAAGRYEHAHSIQQLIKGTLSNSDPRAKLRSFIAESICRRAIYANNISELRSLRDDIAKILDINTFKDYLAYLLNRLSFEYGLTLLLLLGIETDSNELKKLHNQISKTIEALKSARPDDPAWNAQVRILEARYLELKSPDDLTKPEELLKEAVELAEKTSFHLLEVEARIAKAVVLLRMGQQDSSGSRCFEEAIFQLNLAQKLNTKAPLTSPFTEFTQPELAAICFLYLARIYNLRNEKISAASNFNMFQNVASREQVEHAWINERLAPEVEREVLVGVIGKMEEKANYDVATQSLVARKRAIEHASKELRTSRIASIAKHLNVSPQTAYAWIRDIENAQLGIQFFGSGSSADSTAKQAQFRMQKEDIERACRLLGTTKKSRIADFLLISRQTLHSRLKDLKSAGFEPKMD